jgi:hypothetical protein
VRALAVVEDLQELEDGLPGLHAGGPGMTVMSSTVGVELNDSTAAVSQTCRARDRLCRIPYLGKQPGCANTPVQLL